MVRNQGLAACGREFSSRGLGSDTWAVFREDAGPFPVFSATRGDGELPATPDLRAMTEEAVADLLTAAGHPDHGGWLTRNIAAGLMTASLEIQSWEGEEWPLESADGERATAWATPADRRTPYDWIRARAGQEHALISTYQDDAVFGLNFIPRHDRQLPNSPVGDRRPRQHLPLPTGRINHVEIVYDTTVEGGACPGLVTEAFLHGKDRSTLLIAAEAYSRDEWHLYDESVVALIDPTAADALDWVPVRKRWRPTTVTRDPQA
jgi:hypothetical protein